MQFCIIVRKQNDDINPSCSPAAAGWSFLRLSVGWNAPNSWQIMLQPACQFSGRVMFSNSAWAAFPGSLDNPGCTAKNRGSDKSVVWINDVLPFWQNMNKRQSGVRIFYEL